jgi:hypothetical protein
LRIGCCCPALEVKVEEHQRAVERALAVATLLNAAAPPAIRSLGVTNEPTDVAPTPTPGDTRPSLWRWRE